MWSFWICDTILGTKLMQVWPSDGRWRTVINGVGDGEHKFHLRDAETALPRAVWRDLARPWARTLVVCWDDVPQFAGLLKRASYHRPSGVLTLSSVELRAMFAKRMPFTVPEYLPNSVLSIVGKSLRGLVRQIVEWGSFRPSPGDWDLPIVLPADEAGAESREWPHHTFPTVEDLITQIQDTEGGPDVHFRPRWSTSDTLEWELRLGTPELSGPTLEWDLTAPEADVLDFEMIIDGAKQLTGVFAVANGSGADMIVGQSPFVGIPGSQLPYRDEKRPFKGFTSEADADARAAAELQAFREPTEFVQYSLQASAVLPYMILGSTLRTWDEGDEFCDDEWTSRTLIGLSGDLTEKLGLEML